MQHFRISDGLAARRKAIHIFITLLILFIFSGTGFAQRLGDTPKEKSAGTSSVQNQKRIEPAKMAYHGSYNLKSETKPPLVLDPKLMTPFSYKSQSPVIPDFLSLDYLKYPGPVRDEYLHSPLRLKPSKHYLSKTEEE